MWDSAAAAASGGAAQQRLLQCEALLLASDSLCLTPYRLNSTDDIPGVFTLMSSHCRRLAAPKVQFISRVLANWQALPG